MRSKMGQTMYKNPEVRQAHSQLKKALKGYKMDQARESWRSGFGAADKQSKTDVVNFEIPGVNDISCEVVRFEKSLLLEMLQKDPKDRTESDMKELR